VNVNGIRKERVDCLLKRACDYYGVDISELTTTQKGRSNSNSVWKWKRYLILILYDNTDLDFTEIQSVLGYKSRPILSIHYNKLKEELSNEFYGSDKIKRNYKTLLTNIGL
jgi:hypothetical protein